MRPPAVQPAWRKGWRERTRLPSRKCAVGQVEGQVRRQVCLLFACVRKETGLSTRDGQPKRLPQNSKPPSLMKTAVVILSDPKSGADESLGRLLNALALAHESQAAGDEVEIVFK